MALAQVVALAGVAALASIPLGAGPRQAPMVGVIDVAKVFEQNPRFAAMKQELDAMKKEWDQQRFELHRTLSEMEEAIKALDPDSESRRRRQLLYDLKLREAEGTERLTMDTLEREMMLRELPIHDEIDVAVRKVAESRGASLVLRLSRRDPAGDLAKLGSSAVRQRYSAARSRDVLYASDEVDLTGDVIRMLMVPPPK
jgi:Skp family chaperone for outer membrane proteins